MFPAGKTRPYFLLLEDLWGYYVIMNKKSYYTDVEEVTEDVFYCTQSSFYISPEKAYIYLEPDDVKCIQCELYNYCLLKEKN